MTLLDHHATAPPQKPNGAAPPPNGAMAAEAAPPPASAATPPPHGAEAARPDAAGRPAARSPVRRYPPEVREHVRRLYEETDKTLKEISAETGVAETTISAWARQDHWVRAAGAPQPRTAGGGRDRGGQRARLMGRLHRVFGRQLAGLEKRARDTAGTEEKDARTLAVLARTFETLIALDRDDGAKPDQPEPVSRGDYRAELSRHLSRWAEEGSRSGGAAGEPA